MGTLAIQPTEALVNDKLAHCGADGDEVEDRSGMLLMIDDRTDLSALPGYPDLEPEQIPKRSVRIERLFGGSVEDMTILVGPGKTLLGPFAYPNRRLYDPETEARLLADPDHDWLVLWEPIPPDGPMRLAYPDGAENLQVVAFMLSSEALRLAESGT